MLIEILNVGHGLCVLLPSDEGSFVFDCGTHNSSEWPPKAWQELARRMGLRPHIETVAVSHLHWDHYSGFLEPLPNVSPDVKVVVPRLPIFQVAPQQQTAADSLRMNFAARLLAYTPRLDPSYGPLQVDLLRQIRRYAPQASPLPQSQGEMFDAAGKTWSVLWPPRRLSLGTRGMTAVQRAVDAYDEAANQHPILRERLQQVQETDGFAALLDGNPERLERQDETSSGNDVFDGDLNADDEPDRADDVLSRAGRLLRQAANPMSLVISQDERVLLTGDATRSAVTGALKFANARRFGIVLTPHHGGSNHVPQSLLQLSSELRVSSAGGPVLSKVPQEYDTIPGAHYITAAGEITAAVRGTRLVGIWRGGLRCHFAFPHEWDWL